MKLITYALRGHALWAAAGDAVGFRRTGGFTLAFTEREAALLQERMTLKREAGAAIEFVSPNAVAMREPGLTRRIVAASWCADDGFANASLTGRFYRARLRDAGIAWREGTRVTRIDRELAAANISLPCTAKSALLAVTTCLPAAMASSIKARAMP